MGRDKVEKTDVSPTNRSLEAAFDDSAEEDLNINANEDRGYAEPHAGGGIRDRHPHLQEMGANLSHYG